MMQETVAIPTEAPTHTINTGTMPNRFTITHTQPPDDCTVFVGLDPDLITVKAVLGLLDVTIRSQDEPPRCDVVIELLYHLLERTPLDWDWVLDLTAIQRYDLHLMDALLTIGKQLHSRDGCLVLHGVCLSAFPEAFAALFLQRCQEEKIEIDMEAIE